MDDGVAGKLEQSAAALGRPKSWLIEQAIASYVADQPWQVRLDDALDAYRGGTETLASHEEAIDRFEAQLRARR